MLLAAHFNLYRERRRPLRNLRYRHGVYWRISVLLEVEAIEQSCNSDPDIHFANFPTDTDSSTFYFVSDVHYIKSDLSYQDQTPSDP